MGSKLRKKKVLKPDGYEDRFAIQKARKRQKLEDDSFTRVFYSMQYISYTALWTGKESGGFDFSPEQLGDMGRYLKEHSDEYDKATLLALEWTHKQMTGFGCFAEAKKFPYSAKMKIYGKPLKKKQDYLIALESITDAVAIFLVVTVSVLREKFAFSGEMIRGWWTKCLEIAELYTKGMTDKFIIKFLEQESGLEFEHEE